MSKCIRVVESALFIIVLCVNLLVQTEARGQTPYYVNSTCGNDSWSGLSATCASPNGPKSTIQAAINAASSANHDIVEVADGTYSGAGNRDIDLTKQITVRSTNGPADCLIDCGGVARAFYIHGTGGTLVSQTVVQGFTIRDGYRTDGGSALLILSRATIRNCDIGDCQAPGGNSEDKYYGTVHCNNFCLIDGCLIASNLATIAGGIHVSNIFGNVRVTVQNTVIEANEATGPGGGVLVDWNNNLDMINCAVRSNRASTEGEEEGYPGGGIYVVEGIAKLVNCTIADNQVVYSPGLHYGVGGGIAVSYVSSVSMTNCVVSGNSVPALGAGGGIFNFAGTVVIANCTFAKNEGGDAGGAYCDFDGELHGTVTVDNSIFWGNTADSGTQFELGDTGSDLEITKCDVQGGEAGFGGGGSATAYTDNISTDPKFVNATTGDFHLAWTSPCHNTGSHSLVPCDGFDLDNDGHNCVTNVEPVPYDLDGATVSPTHVREVCVVEMGAFEVQTESCSGDCSGGGDNPPDHQVDIDDLLAVITSWSSTQGGYADITCDSMVNIDDLLAVVTGWGPCPNFTGNEDEFPTTVEGCMNRCSGVYDEESDEWAECVNQCVQGLCEAHIIDCD